MSHFENSKKCAINWAKTRLFNSFSTFEILNFKKYVKNMKRCLSPFLMTPWTQKRKIKSRDKTFQKNFANYGHKLKISRIRTNGVYPEKSLWFESDWILKVSHVTYTQFFFKLSRDDFAFQTWNCFWTKNWSFEFRLDRFFWVILIKLFLVHINIKNIFPVIISCKLMKTVLKMWKNIKLHAISWNLLKSKKFRRLFSQFSFPWNVQWHFMFFQHKTIYI